MPRRKMHLILLLLVNLLGFLTWRWLVRTPDVITGVITMTRSGDEYQHGEGKGRSGLKTADVVSGAKTDANVDRKISYTAAGATDIFYDVRGNDGAFRFQEIHGNFALSPDTSHGVNNDAKFGVDSDRGVNADEVPGLENDAKFGVDSDRGVNADEVPGLENDAKFVVDSDRGVNTDEIPGLKNDANFGVDSDRGVNADEVPGLENDANFGVDSDRGVNADEVPGLKNDANFGVDSDRGVNADEVPGLENDANFGVDSDRGVNADEVPGLKNDANFGVDSDRGVNADEVPGFKNDANFGVDSDRVVNADEVSGLKNDANFVVSTNKGVNSDTFHGHSAEKDADSGINADTISGGKIESIPGETSDGDYGAKNSIASDKSVGVRDDRNSESSAVGKSSVKNDRNFNTIADIEKKPEIPSNAENIVDSGRGARDFSQNVDDGVFGVKTEVTKSYFGDTRSEVSGVKAGDNDAIRKAYGVPDWKKEVGSSSGKDERGEVVKSNADTGTKQTQQLELCPKNPPINETEVPLNLTKVTYDDLRQALGHVMQTGGRYAPSTCKSRERLAIIIPFRDRLRNLYVLLRNLVPFLVRQQADFTVFVVEQSRDYLFNRCLMFNVGYALAQQYGNFSCFILHDTDLIPRDYRNLYRCHPSKPRHMMVERSNEVSRESLPYHSFIGGVLALRKEHVEAANGCSNSYYGWGLEDDDLGIRLQSRGLALTRVPMTIGTYYSLGHVKQTHNSASENLRRTIRQRMRIDGLNTLKYTLLQQQQFALFTWFLVKPPPPPSEIYGRHDHQHQPPPPASS